jgi:hypothetical protein
MAACVADIEPYLAAPEGASIRLIASCKRTCAAKFGAAQSARLRWTCWSERANAFLPPRLCLRAPRPPAIPPLCPLGR